MWLLKTFPLFLLFVVQVTRAATRDCCANPNTLGKSKCLNGKETILKCVKYLVTAEKNQTLKFRDDFFLLDDDVEIDSERYLFF